MSQNVFDVALTLNTDGNLPTLRVYKVSWHSVDDVYYFGSEFRAHDVANDEVPNEVGHIEPIDVFI